MIAFIKGKKGNPTLHGKLIMHVSLTSALTLMHHIHYCKSLKHVDTNSKRGLKFFLLLILWCFLTFIYLKDVREDKRWFYCTDEKNNHSNTFSYLDLICLYDPLDLISIITDVQTIPVGLTASTSKEIKVLSFF